MDNPEKLAKLLQQQQAMKFLQSMQGGMSSGYQGAMGEAERMQMPQDPMQGGMPIVQPQADYGMPMPQQSYSANMPTNPQMARRGMLQGAINSLGQQSAGQGAMSNQDVEMMRKR